MSGRVSQKIFLRPVSGSGLLGLAHPTNWLRSHRRSRRSRAGTSTPPPSPSLYLSLSRTSVRRSWHILLVSPFIRWRFFRLPAPLSISGIWWLHLKGFLHRCILTLAMWAGWCAEDQHTSPAPILTQKVWYSGFCLALIWSTRRF